MLVAPHSLVLMWVIKAVIARPGGPAFSRRHAKGGLIRVAPPLSVSPPIPIRDPQYGDAAC